MLPDGRVLTEDEDFGRLYRGRVQTVSYIEVIEEHLVPPGPRLSASLKDGTREDIHRLVAEHHDKVVRRGSHGAMALLEAARSARADGLSALLTHGADVNGVDEEGWTALHICSSQGFIDGCRILVEHGAQIELRNNKGRTPLEQAVWNAQPAGALWLLTQGASCPPGSYVDLDNRRTSDLTNVTPKRAAVIGGFALELSGLLQREPTAGSPGDELGALRALAMGAGGYRSDGSDRCDQELLAVLDAQSVHNRLDRIRRKGNALGTSRTLRGLG